MVKIQRENVSSWILEGEKEGVPGGDFGKQYELSIMWSKPD